MTLKDTMTTIALVTAGLAACTQTSKDTTVPTGGADGSPCSKPLSGTTAFGSALSGTATFSTTVDTAQAATRTIGAYIYFPAGRVAGAPVQLAMASPVVSTQYFFGPPVTLASDLSAAGLTVSGHDTELTGNLLPGADGLRATVSTNFASPSSDVGDIRESSAMLCPSGDLPSPELQLLVSDVSPLSTLHLFATAPIPADAMNALRVTTPLGPVALKVSPNVTSTPRYATGPTFFASATTAFPPGQPLTFDTSAVKDVLGRPVTFAGTATVQGTSAGAVLSDLTFSTPPPDGSVYCTTETELVTIAAAYDAGTAAMTALKINGSRAGDVDALLALPTITNASKLRVRLALGEVKDLGTGCQLNIGSYASPASFHAAAIAVVGHQGEASATVVPTCNGSMADYVFDLPSATPLWLAVHVDRFERMPFFGPQLDLLPPITLDAIDLQ